MFKKYFLSHAGKIGIAIVILNALCILNSAFFFLVTARFSPVAWIFFNACAPSTLIFITGFILRKKAVMVASLPFLCFFGIGGMFVFGWSGTSLIAQVGHICMAMAVIYTILLMYAEGGKRSVVRGLIAGFIAFAVFFPFQHKYVIDHPELVKKLADPTFEKSVNVE
ncbi:MAG TPA: hypothetical protein PKK43_03910 [Spirochaetota bacterium]|nr:hypothetical protein [Spirochaetota bacterium]